MIQEFTNESRFLPATMELVKIGSKLDAEIESTDPDLSAGCVAGPHLGHSGYRQC